MIKKNYLPVIYCLLFFILSFLFLSCSTAAKNSGEIFTLRTQSETWLRAGNREAEQGKFKEAIVLLTDAKRYAIMADDSSLIIRSCLSRGNVLYSLGISNEAFAEWEHAVAEAKRFGDEELLAVSLIYLARGNLISEKVPARSVLDEVNRESAKIKKNSLFLAFSWQVKGLAHRSLGSFSDAEAAFRRSLEIHLRGKNMENASYDWFTIASIRSLAGNTQGALLALQESIKIDQRIENSWGLAASYRAMGDVYRKIGNNQADAMYIRARMIYAAMGNDHEVAQMDIRIRNNR